MNLVLLTDTETTGTDPETDRLVEVAAILWSVQDTCAVACWSTLVQGSENPAASVNGITAASLRLGMPRDQAVAALLYYARLVDAIVAHNAEFDRGFLPELAQVKPWICTQFDVEWPKTKPGYNSLVGICLAHGLGVSHAHRALTDCVLISRMLERCHEMGRDVGKMLERGLRPKATFVALVDYEDKDLAKDAGFKWEKETKRWKRTMAIEDAAGLGFPVRRLG